MSYIKNAPNYPVKSVSYKRGFRTIRQDGYEGYFAIGGILKRGLIGNSLSIQLKSGEYKKGDIIKITRGGSSGYELNLFRHKLDNKEEYTYSVFSDDIIFDPTGLISVEITYKDKSGNKKTIGKANLNLESYYSAYGHSLLYKFIDVVSEVDITLPPWNEGAETTYCDMDIVYYG